MYMDLVIIVGDVDNVDKKILAHRWDNKNLRSPHIGFIASSQTLGGVEKT